MFHTSRRLQCSVVLTVCLSVLSGCSHTSQTDGPVKEANADRDGARQDPHSYAVSKVAQVSHLQWDVDVDFEQQRLHAKAALTIDRVPEATELRLDTRALNIVACTDAAGRPLAYHLGEPDPILGRAMVIQLSPDTAQVIIQYHTTSGAQALQWLSPQQTAGKKKPYLFTQGQAILTRTYIPLQDSPGIRLTYDATVRVPLGFTAVMSADKGEVTSSETTATFRFRSQEAIPPYLLALAVGELEFRELGPRTGVYAEPSVVAAAANEFTEIESMIDAVEKLYGPYRWGRYDILVLPPSFPFGGMENPKLTFLSPTTIAGDRSLTSILAHELAHSWSGNLVTNATWADFWLNEGFTTYIESRILEAVYDVERARIVESIGRRDLLHEMKDFGDQNPATALYHRIDGENPDDSITSIPYDKGSAFLHMLEANLGRESFDAFLKGYFDAGAFQSMTTKKFLQRLTTKFGAERLDELRVREWVYEPGLPENLPEITSEKLERIEKSAKIFSVTNQIPMATFMSYEPLEWVIFFRALKPSVELDALLMLNNKFKFSAVSNSEVRFEYLHKTLTLGDTSERAAVEKFLTEQGRRKFVRPLFEALMTTAWGRQVAMELYPKARPGYHPLTQETIDAIVTLPTATSQL